MADTLLDYAFTVNPVAPLPPANAAYIKAVLAIVKPKAGVAKEIVVCNSKAQAQTLTANADILELFNAGMTSVRVLPVADLSDAEALIEPAMKDFYTILISSDFESADLADFARGEFKGVVGYSFSVVDSTSKAFAVVDKQCAFISSTANGAKNMFFAFGALLSGTSWTNQQYITMPYSDGIVELGEAKNLYNERYSFVLTSDEYGNRLAFFVAGKQAITAAYIIENLTLDSQSAAVSFITTNKPDYTITNAKLLESAVELALNNKYIVTGLVESVSLTISLINDNFRATGQIVVPIPKALWGVDVDLIQGA